MQVTKCDKCRKEIKDYRSRVVAGAGGSFGTEHVFCPKCGAPVRAFLKKLGLLKGE
jgi:hypothetical protein